MKTISLRLSFGDPREWSAGSCLALLIASGVFVSPLCAQPIERTFVTENGLSYTGEITKVEPDGITVLYAEGVRKLPFGMLSTAVQEEFKYDPEKAVAYRRQVVKAAALQRAAQAKHEAAAATPVPAATPAPRSQATASVGTPRLMDQGPGAAGKKGGTGLMIKRLELR